MKRFLSVVSALAVLTSQAFAGAPPIPPSPQVDGRIAAFNGRLRIIGNVTPYPLSVASSSFPGTSRTLYVTRGGLTKIRLALASHYANGGSETTVNTPQIQRASLEYPLGTAVRNFTVHGRTSWAVDNSQSVAWTDDLGVNIPPGGQFAIRFWQKPVMPPTSLTATPAAGGALTTGTTYYYKIVTVDSVGQATSNQSSEVSATASGSNLSITLSWTNAWMPSAYNIYRGVSAGSESFLTTVNAPISSWTDAGALTTISGLSPPAFATGYSANLRSHLAPGEGYSGNQFDYTNVTTALANTVATDTAQSEAGPYAIAGDDPAVVSVVAIGDSILSSMAYPFAAGGSPNGGTDVGNYFDLGLRGLSGFSTLNIALAGAKIQDFAPGNSQSVSARLSMLQYGDAVFSELGRNDLSSQSWQQIAANQLQVAKQVYSTGRRFYLATLLPATNSTDWFQTYANQTTNSWESVRAAYNSWIRAGSPVDGSGAPNMSGGPSPYVAGYFDAAVQVERNSSGTLALNGGYWSLASTYQSGIAATGAPTATSLPTGQSWTAHALTNFLVKMTSGTYSGQYALVSDNGTNTLTLYTSGATVGGVAAPGLSGAPAAGDQFTLYALPTVDGTHPERSVNATIGTALGAWAPSNLRR
jgi:hypothetical protein